MTLRYHPGNFWAYVKGKDSTPLATTPLANHGGQTSAEPVLRGAGPHAAGTAAAPQADGLIDAVPNKSLHRTAATRGASRYALVLELPNLLPVLSG